MTESPLIASLLRAIEAAPHEIELRLHVAELLLAEGHSNDAVAQAAAALTIDPSSHKARELMARAVTPPTDAEPAPPADEDPADPAATPPPAKFDWRQAESDVGGILPPMFVDSSGESTSEPAHEVQRSTVRLADVGGMDEVKQRLQASFLAPLQNPELRQLYGKSLRGGLLLYGPPGCGKTFIAKAIAGELSASFMSVSLSGILDMFVGNSEKNVTELFAQARESAPCVLFLDELDAIGMKRTLTRHSGMRGAVNQLLTELDGIETNNEGVYVLGATNQPWDVDPALRRPGRLDRVLLVVPPDRPAREAIFRLHLKGRPVEGIDLGFLAKATEGYSGADIAHICETASEHALLDSVATGTARMIQMKDLKAALDEVRPSIGPWMETARNVALYGNQTGEWDDLAKFLRKHGRKST